MLHGVRGVSQEWVDHFSQTATHLEKGVEAADVNALVFDDTTLVCAAVHEIQRECNRLQGWGGGELASANGR